MALPPAAAAAAVTAGRSLITKVGLTPGAISKAGAWLKTDRVGAPLAKATTLATGALPLGPARSAASSSQAAQQVARYRS